MTRENCAPLLLACLVATGCSTSSSAGGARPAAAAPGRTPSGFPTEDAIASLDEVPLPDASAGARRLDIDEWKLAGPLPAVLPLPLDAAFRPESKAEEALAAVSQEQPGVRPTAAMRCIARELGRFYLEKQSYPSRSLQAFVLARCGSSVAQVRISGLGGTVPDGVTDADVHKNWGDQLADAFRKLPRAPGTTAGVWFGRNAERATYVIVSGVRSAALMGLSQASDTARFTVSGQLGEPAGAMRAFINRGRFGVGECVVDGSALPQFKLECEADPADTYAWIEVAAFPPGRILGKTVLNVLVWPGGEMGDTYVRAAAANNTAVSDGDDLVAVLLPEVNALRKDAKLSPLEIEPAQSNVAARLAPYYFASLTGNFDPAISETIVLGLRAGWSVRGTVHHGNVTAAASIGDTTVGKLLGSAVERPFGREVLFDPTARRIAVGAINIKETKFNGAVLVTYALFEPDPSMALADQVFERIVLMRQQALKPAPEKFDVRDAIAGLAGDVTEGKLKPSDALNQMLARSASVGRGVRGWIYETQNIEELSLPDEIAQSDAVKLAVAVAHYQPEGEPWGRYVVFLIVEAESSTAERRPATDALAAAAQRPGSVNFRALHPL